MIKTFLEYDFATFLRRCYSIRLWDRDKTIQQS